MQRRQFLALCASSAGSVLLSRCGRGQTQTAPEPQVKRPKLHTSRNGVLELDLEASAREINLGDETVDLLAYNGQIPGPRLEAKLGDTVRIRFQNNLPDPTNLHYHGLHIPPTGNADNVFLSVGSGEQVTYEFSIPQTHSGGLAYYHPHLHGYVADQILGGLGGIFVVRGPLDEIPEIQAAEEIFLFLKDFVVEQDRPMMGRMAGREGDLVTVNGQVNPSFSIPAGGLARLRLVNASNARFYRLALEKHPFYLIATDGHPLSVPVEMSELLLSPGERAEVLVRGEQEPGEYRLLDLPYSRGQMGMMGGMMGQNRRRPGMMGREHMGPGMMHQNDQDSPQTLATLSYSGQVEPQSLPQKLLPVDDLASPTTERKFALNHGMVPGQGMVFLINGKSFDPQRIDTEVALDTIEDWDISNTGVMDHPFHLHTNPFQVIARNGKPEPYQTWKDTVLIPTGETVRIRIPFKDYPGKTVYHCHILDHEELGMMGTIEMQA
ncbi:multicopper oxidase family protein [Acaryochloris sp. CCMEE 5410]|uniref:multicopper oxidase family protein n=1 Tax=Acaryochloris sp. CCMEE 5410 TaxID=310037 RepID=UPI00024847FD|nr:multicopper oxidase family protein [Acaryochloris sp. CCMEE 5410]KAI9129961.1 multicopper oxidase family protein [Acaryochloris sp. CCMEE 5410]